MSEDRTGVIVEEHELVLEPGPTRFLTAAASPARHDRERIVRVYGPGDDRPYLVQVVDEMTAPVELVVPPGRGGRWRVAIERAASSMEGGAAVNKDAVPPPVAPALTVESVAAREIRVPLRVINRSLRNALEGFSPRLTLDTVSGGTLAFPGPAAKDFKLKPIDFKLKPFKKWIWTAHVRDLKNKVNADGTLAASITIEPGNARYRNGFVKIVVEFEEEGQELQISWAPDADVSNLKLTAMIGLGLDGGVPVPEDVDVHLPVRLDFNVVPDSLVDALAGYSRYVQRLIEAKILDYAHDPNTHETIKKYVAPKIAKALSGGKLTRIDVDTQFVHLFY